MTWRRLLRDRAVRQNLAQLAVVLALLLLGYGFVTTALANMARQNMGTGFGFLDSVAGFDVTLKLIPYGQGSSYGRVLLVALLNTLLVAAVAIVLSTILGFLIGIARLSTNWLLATLATVYVELVRNIPLLLLIYLCYFGFVQALPVAQSGLALGGVMFLNQRGLFMPSPSSADPILAFGAALLVGAVASEAVRRWSARRHAASGRRLPVLPIALVLTVGLPLLAAGLAGTRIAWDVPQPGRFGIRGGISVIPEFVGLLLALTLYTASFTAETVRGGILAVGAGQREAARALGLKPVQVLRLIVLPQALRIILPPLINQHVNVIKNSSFGAIIAYPELVNVFMGTTLNQTGHAIEIAVIAVGIYLAINLSVSAAVNWYNHHIAVVTR